MIGGLLARLVLIAGLVWLICFEFVLGLPLVSITLVLVALHYLPQARMLTLCLTAILLASLYQLSLTATLLVVAVAFALAEYGGRYTARPSVRLLLASWLVVVFIAAETRLEVTGPLVLQVVIAAVVSVVIIWRTIGSGRAPAGRLATIS